MNETTAIFKKISYGAKFDFKKFKKDAELLGLIYSKKDNVLLNELNSDENGQPDNPPQKMKKTCSNEMNNGSLSIENSNKDCVKVFGDVSYQPISTFKNIDAKIPAFLKKSLKEMKYINPTPIQSHSIPLLLQGRQILACAPTGSGKTLAYLFPILTSLSQKLLSNNVHAVVVLPTIELAKQIYNEAKILADDSKIKLMLLSKLSQNSSKSKKPIKINTYDILISTPQRLVDHINHSSLDLSLVEWLVFDEGDLLFLDGRKGFRNQIAIIHNSCSNSLIKRCVFSATLGNEIESWAQIYLTNLVSVLVGSKDSAPESIKQELLFTGQESGKILAIRNIIRTNLDPPILIFVNSIQKAQELHKELIYDGVNAEVMHSDRTEAQRNRIITAFRTGKIWILITTDLMSRGIDFKGIKQVINYDIPTSHINYLHRIGRSGRAGMSGSAITLFTENDMDYVKNILPVLKASNVPIPEWLEKAINSKS